MTATPTRRYREFGWLVGRQGIEPWTRGLKVRRSAIELTAHGRWQSLFSWHRVSFSLRSESETRTHGLRVMSPPL